MAVFLDKDHFIGNRDWLININIIRKMCIIPQIRNQVTRVPSPNSPLSRYWRWVMSWCRGETQDGERGADWYLHHYHHHHHSYHDHNSPPGIEGPIGWQPLYHQRSWVASTLLYWVTGVLTSHWVLDWMKILKSGCIELLICTSSQIFPSSKSGNLTRSVLVCYTIA